MMQSEAPLEDYFADTKSAKGYYWGLRTHDERQIMLYAQRYKIAELLARILIGRDIEIEEVKDFLSPTLKHLLPDPFDLKDMKLATMRVADAILKGEKMIIFGDYDVDGATSSALLKNFIEAAGGLAQIYIPDRIKEGYGPSISAMEKFASQGYKLVITLDCGTTAFAPLEAAKEKGIDLIVIDHHVAQPNLPPCYALINPNRLDEKNDLGHLAAVGVTFLFAIALNRHLREKKYYETKGIAEPNLLNSLDLVALGTVCDVVSLTTLNRAFVTQGLKVMQQRRNLGLTTLIDTAKIAEPPQAYHAGFVLGPRINAGGRVGKASLGADLLSSKDPYFTGPTALQLDGFNEERKAIESLVLEEAILEVERNNLQHNPIILACGQNWHPGVIGIVASRLKDKYKKPSCVIAFDSKTGLGKASGRSIKGIDLGSAIISAVQSTLLVAGGGHQMAVGFTVSHEGFEKFNLFMQERIAIDTEKNQLDTSLKADAILAPGGIHAALIKSLEQIAPYGTGNAEPKFILPYCTLAYYKILGDAHFKCTLKGRDIGAGPIKQTVDAIAFRIMDQPLGKMLVIAAQNRRPIHLFGSAKMNYFMGRATPQFMIEDAMNPA